MEEDKEEEGEVRRGRLETAETFQRESLGTAGNSVLLLPAAAAAAQMAAADSVPQNGSREETVVATEQQQPSSGAQQAGKAASNGHRLAPTPHLQPGGAQRKNLDCFNFTGRQPAPVMTKIGSRDPMVKKMVYNQYRDMLRKYSNTSTSP